MSNETISKWLGECRHEDHYYKNSMQGGYYSCNTCDRTHDSNDYGDFFGDVTDYENDESAWTQELYGKIEEAGLVGQFISWLKYPTDSLSHKSDRGLFMDAFTQNKVFCMGVEYYFNLIKATPPQKALALSRAIEEVS